MSKPIFEFKGYKIKSLLYSDEIIVEGEVKDKDNNELKFEAEHGFTEDFTKGKLQLSINLKSDKDKKRLALTVVGFFDINDSLLKNDDGTNRTSEEINDIFLVNATAIIYPYLRSIVSVVSALDNSDNIVLPTINLRNFGKS